MDRHSDPLLPIKYCPYREDNTVQSKKNKKWGENVPFFNLNSLFVSRFSKDLIFRRIMSEKNVRDLNAEIDLDA